MPNALVVAGAVLLLTAGTYAFRWAGPALPEHLISSARARATVNAAAVLLLAGVMATTAATEDQHFAGWARVLGVATAGVLAWRRAPFVVTLIVAAAVTGACRALGLP